MQNASSERLNLKQNMRVLRATRLSRIENSTCLERNAYFLRKILKCFERLADFALKNADASSEMLKISWPSSVVAPLRFHCFPACFGERPAPGRPGKQKCLKSASNGRQIIRICNGLPEAEIQKVNFRGLERTQPSSVIPWFHCQLTPLARNTCIFQEKMQNASSEKLILKQNMRVLRAKR